MQCYLQLGVIVIAAGAIYPLIYLRQNFEVTILESFGITAAQLGESYAMLGVLFVLTYVPSGWLADRVAPRILMSFSLAMAGVLGIWFSTMPDFWSIRVIFAGWGIATGLTFWSALIKATALLARPEEQGRFFGILDGGRGLVEAILATIAVGMFAYWIESLGQSAENALHKVIWFYTGFMLILSPIVLFLIRDNRRDANDDDMIGQKGSFTGDVRTVVSRVEVWLVAACILTGYQLFWATYSFSAYMQIHYGLSAVAVGSITVAKLWMRPIGAVTAGFAGDFLDRERVLAILMLLATIALMGLVVLPTNSAIVVLLGMVLIIGLLTYAVRGIYWATLQSCDIPDRIKGLAIGAISLIGYAPDIYLPLLNGYLLDRFPGKAGFTIYFAIISAMGLLGVAAAWRLKVIVAARKNAASPQQS